MKLLILLLVLLVPTASGANDGSQDTRHSLRGTPDGEALRGVGQHMQAGVDPAGLAGVPLQGLATWYCGGDSPCTTGYDPFDYIAAIDPSTGIRRGALLRVSSGGRSVRVTVVDICACSGRRIIDLSRIAFSALADPARGLIPVTLAPAGDAPPTYTEGAP
jgi:rare lipoprotein A (RlpA)-like double-psi beta-barrel protein